MLENIEVLNHNCIRFNKEKVIYTDPFQLKNHYNDADIILITHSHYDHFSEEDIEKVRSENTIICITKDLYDRTLELGFSKENIVTVEPSHSYQILGIGIKTIPAYNISKKFHPKENNWVGYLLNLQGKVYYVAGDTDITEENKKVSCDVAFVPVGGTYTMDSKEATELINEIKPTMAVPVHYGSVVGEEKDAEMFVQNLEEGIEGKILKERKCNMEEEYLEFAKEIAEEAGKIMLKYFKTDNGSTYKGDKTIVTLADKEINAYLIKRVKEKFQNHCVDGEEESFGKSNYVWVCDPVDGTAMYARYIPIAVFSLALVVDGVPIVGVVYDVFTDSLYTAIKGKGAFKNNNKIMVNTDGFDGMKTVSNFDMAPVLEYNIYDIIKELGKETFFVSLGSAIRACMYVASGEFNFTIFPGTTHRNCDIAAAKVIVEEAGGTVTDLFGNEQRYDMSINGAVVSNGVVHEHVIETVKKYIEDYKKA